MNKEQVLGKYGYFDMVHNVTLKAVAQLKDDQLDFRPAPEMRTAKELLSHLFGQECALIEGIRNRRLAQADFEAIDKDGLNTKTVAELIAYAKNCHQRAKAALEQTTEEQITGNMDTFFGSYPGWQLAMFAYDEHWHHRGQFYTY